MQTANVTVYIQYQTTSCGVAYLHNQLRQLQQAVRSLSEDASKTLSPVAWATVQSSVFWHLGRTDEQVAVGSDSERRRQSDYWYSTFRLHNAGAPIHTLATGTPASARRLQGCDARSSVCVWHFAIVR